MTWKNIETAPKDGREILIWDEYNTVPVVGAWDNHSKKWRGSFNNSFVIEYQSDFGTEYVIIHCPVMWTEIPEIPVKG